MKPQSVPPWAKETTAGAYTRYMALTRAIRANDNRARYARDAEERAHYLNANRVLERQRAKLVAKITPPERQKQGTEPLTPQNPPTTHPTKNKPRRKAHSP